MYRVCSAEELVESVVEELVSAQCCGRSVFCHACRRFGEALDPGIPICPSCGSYQTDFVDGIDRPDPEPRAGDSEASSDAPDDERYY